MNSAQRLAELASGFEEVGLSYLVMGGHAVRFYGVDRNTLDFDFHLSFPEFNRLAEVLNRASVFAAAPLVEGPSWRPDCFRRFIVGALADGREERLECWRQNHLLAPFPELYCRRETGPYGGRLIPFLALPDLIRSKETERESDWQDVALLEEILDARNLALAVDAAATVRALSQLRSRRGCERAIAAGHLSACQLVAEAYDRADTAISRAYLTPWLPAGFTSATCPGMIGEVLSGPLRAVAPGSARHFALAEVVRRLHKQAAMQADRADKLKASQGQD